eukprot:2627859-Amphidinium_carterae.1
MINCEATISKRTATNCWQPGVTLRIAGELTGLPFGEAERIKYGFTFTNLCTLHWSVARPNGRMDPGLLTQCSTTWGCPATLPTPFDSTIPSDVQHILHVSLQGSFGETVQVSMEFNPNLLQ